VKVRFVYPRFQRHAEAHPELLEHVPCNEYFGPPSLGIASLAACTPTDRWEFDFRDDRVEDVGLDDPVDLVAISCFTPSAMRAMQLADAFRARGRRVVMGGIFPTMMPDEAGAHADAVVVGEGEGVWPDVLDDALRGTLQPRYRETTPVDLARLPLPRVDLYIAKEGGAYRPDDYPVQLSRGCPLRCSACVLPTSMGRALRHLPVEHVLGQIDQLAAHGKLGSFTEDTSFFFGSGAQRRFSELLDVLTERGGPARLSYVGISMPLLLAAPDEALARLRRAGMSMFYLVGGFDPITQRAFTGRDAKAYRRACDAIARAHDAGVEPYTSFLVGNDDDDEGTFDRMLAFAEKTNIRKAEFAILTPYPGTPIWHRFVEEGRILDRNWAHYNDANVVFRPMHMKPERLLEGYLYLWREFYRPRQSLRALDHDARTIQF
jgi:radical SAM superfamily enzyme YgiQ (UPF0313 family)